MIAGSFASLSVRSTWYGTVPASKRLTRSAIRSHTRSAASGFRIFGSGPFTGKGTYTTLLPAGGPCLQRVGTGVVDYTFQSGAMIFHKQEKQQFIVAGIGKLTTPSIRATLQLAPPYNGDCLTKPVTRATFAAEGAMVWTAPFFLDPSSVERPAS